jgi:hypothetical protein
MDEKFIPHARQPAPRQAHTCKGNARDAGVPDSPTFEFKWWLAGFAVARRGGELGPIFINPTADLSMEYNYLRATTHREPRSRHLLGLFMLSNTVIPESQALNC